MINFIYKKISDRMEPSQPGFIRPSQLGKHASLLHKMSVEVSISQKKKKHGSSKHVKIGVDNLCK